MIAKKFRNTSILTHFRSFLPYLDLLEPLHDNKNVFLLDLIKVHYIIVSSAQT